MSEEIKLGWYRTNVVSMFDPVEVVYVSSNQVVFATKNCGLKIEDAATFAKYRDYIGTELGEWVSPDEVTISEMRKHIKARFRNKDNEQWIEAELMGFYATAAQKYSACGYGSFNQCQVWRSKK